MAIKKQPVLTKDDFEQALIALRLSVSEVARETGIPRHVVSHFRNYNDGMKPEELAKLRDYLEGLGVEFTDKEEVADQSQPTIASLHPQLGVGIQQVHYFPISSNIPDEVIRDAMYIMDENDARLMLLLQNKLERNGGFLGNGELTEETKATLQEAFALLAGNYITFRLLRGWPVLNVQPTNDKPQTVRDMILQTFMQPLIDAGLIVAPDQAEESEAAEVTA